MRKPIVIPALFCRNFDEVAKMEEMNVEVEKDMELRNVYIYDIDTTQPLGNPVEYNDGIVVKTIVFTKTTEYTTTLTQQEIYKLYNESD